ncbi:unnamed protein product [Hyaloperonospora brassicae]|uniref:Vesicle transport protein n=1 Tax=Hyaloperonospora brassicae TaxID=162125 RepID=A0AAV0TDQ8_HYABA|nr:unnamed protein product [Hyaloperonospora brassicae]
MSAWEQWGGKKKPSSSSEQVAGRPRGAAESAALVCHVVQRPRERQQRDNDVRVPKDVGLGARVDKNVATSLGGRKTATSLRGLGLPTMSWNARFKYFVAMTLLGLLFFGMAFVFLPLLVVRPSKFALSFTLGSMCCMSAVAMLKGPAAYAVELLQPHRLLLTCAYFVTLGCTLYSCLVLGDYVFVVLSAVLQLLTLGSFALSAFPSGTSSLRAFTTLFWKSARGMVQAITRVLLR